MDLDSMDFMSASLGEKWMAETVRESMRRRPNLFSSAQQGERRERNSKWAKTLQAVRVEQT